MRGLASALVVLVLGGAYTMAADHPDSVRAPLSAGCNRSNFLYLGEAAAALQHEGGPDVAPEWTYVVDPKHSDDPRTIRTLVGTVLASHTAGQDLFGNHRTYDLNVDVAPDRAYQNLLSSRNTEEKPPQIHTEWESGLAPLWSWPSAGDRVRETGSFIWDCGHWQEGTRQIPNSDDVPTDPLGTAGIEKVGGEQAEIHPMSELATWRAPHAFVPPRATAAVPVSQLDVYISNQGGGAKSVIECAVAPAAPQRTAQRAAQDHGCSSLQNVTDRDYTYDLYAPRRPSATARLRWMELDHASHSAPHARVRVLGNHVRITVPFKSATPSSGLQNFGASFYVWWSGRQPAVHAFRVRLTRLVIYNNLDGDSNQQSYNNQNGNATITPNGEWNVYVDVGGVWRALQTEMNAAHAGDLGNIPTKDARRPYDLSRLAPTDLDLVGGEALTLLVDARDCDLPGFTDCPAGHELAFSQNPGRAAVSIPVERLIGRSAAFTIHPAPCGQSCDDNHSDKACMPTWCYAVSFSVTDLATHAPTAMTVIGDGTAAHSTVDGVPASKLGWWAPPPLRASVDQNEEAPFIRRAIAQVLGIKDPTDPDN